MENARVFWANGFAEGQGAQQSGATQRVFACYLLFGPGGHGGPLFKMQESLIKTGKFIKWLFLRYLCIL